MIWASLPEDFLELYHDADYEVYFEGLANLLQDVKFRYFESISHVAQCPLDELLFERLGWHADVLKGCPEPGKATKPVETPPNENPPAEAEFVFRKDGDGYFLKGFGEQGQVSASRAKGLHDLFQIVQTPGVPVPMMELNVRQGEKRTEGDGRSRQPVADSKTFEQIKTKRRELKSDIEAAKSDLERNELQGELDQLESAARGMTGIKGKSRDINNPLDRLRPKFIGRLATAIARIRERQLPSLANHFENTVTTEAGGLLYSPGVPNLSWDASDKK